MRGRISVDKDTYSSIEEMLKENLNLNQIVSTLKKERNTSYNYTTIQTLIKRDFGKVWDKEKKKWINKEPDFKFPKGYVEGQFGLFEIQEMKDKNATVKDIKAEDDSIAEKKLSELKVPTEKTNTKNHSENMSTITQKIYKIQKDVEDIKKILFRLERDNPKHRIIEVTDEFFKIYASDKNKSSVSINTELRDKAKRMMEEAFGIKDNDSLVINLALLIALYRGR